MPSLRLQCPAVAVMTLVPPSTLLLLWSLALMTFMPNSATARDIKYHIHPHTNFRQHEETGSLC